MQSDITNAREYWASLPTDEIGKEVQGRVDKYDEFLSASGIMLELRDSYSTYYGTTQVGRSGEQGELANLKVNHYASLIESMLSMVTSQRPAWEARATNTDVKSQQQVILANGLLDYYAREKRMERFLKDATRTALYLREGWLSVTWDPNDGEIVSRDPETGIPIAQGDVNYRVYRLPDVVRDYNREDSNHDWLILRDYKNKYDIASKYPEYADRIVALQQDEQSMMRFRFNFAWDQETDQIPVYTFYHRKTEALPNGRMVTFLDDDIILFDGALPYKKMPIFKIAGAERAETPFGHSNAMNVMPIQKALDSLFSSVLTNQSAFGVQSVLVPKGSGVTLTQVSGGMNMIEYDPKLGAPTPLNLTQTPPELFNFLNMLIDQAQTISGVNAVARGNASPQLSGAAMALLQSTALQFSAGIQQSYTQLVEDIGTATIHLLQQYANEPRIAYIVGKHNRSMQQSFKSDDLENISRVTVDSASALSKTIAGKTEIANQLLQAGLIKRPEQYLMVLQTGSLEAMYENETSELVNIRAENQGLAEGTPQVAMGIDDHRLHILEHKSVLNSPEARRDPKIAQAAMAHILEHVALARDTDPGLQMMLGYNPLPPAQPMMPPGMGQPMPQDQVPNQIPPTVSNTPSEVEAAGNISDPNMPRDPLSGQRMDANGPTQ